MANGHFFHKRRIIMTWFFSIGLVIVILFSSSYWENIYLLSDMFFLMGAVLVGVATVGRLWCSVYIAGYKTNTLITTGPYSMCRNPLYFFSLLGSVGVGLGTETLIIPAIISIGFVLYYPYVIKGEEKTLLRVHKNTFEEYRNTTPKFFPSFSLLNEPEQYTIKPKIFRRSIFDALWFVWIMGILEIVEALHEYAVIPIFLRLY